MTTLAQRARKAGIGVEERPCEQCGGVMLYADPIDLWKRRKKYASRSAFARSVKKPDGKVGCAVSFIVMVETDPSEGRPGRHRRCPEWLLEEYIRLPSMGLKPTDEKRLGAFIAAGKASAKARASARSERVGKGQIWRKAAVGDAPPVQLEVLQVVPAGEAPETALVRRLDREQDPPFTLTTKSLRKSYEAVTL